MTLKGDSLSSYHVIIGQGVLGGWGRGKYEIFGKKILGVRKMFENFWGVRKMLIFFEKSSYPCPHEKMHLKRSPLFKYHRHTVVSSTHDSLNRLKMQLQRCNTYLVATGGTCPFELHQCSIILNGYFTCAIRQAGEYFHGRFGGEVVCVEIG